MEVKINEHPLCKHYLAMLRDARISQAEFRDYFTKISRLIIQEILSDLEGKDEKVTTPLEETYGKTITNSIVIGVPILRAGIGMLQAAMEVFPHIKIGFLGYMRDHKSLKPQLYYDGLPEILKCDKVIILEPMIATGGTISAAIERISNAGVKKIEVASIVVAPQGISQIENNKLSATIYCAAVDRELKKMDTFSRDWEMLEIGFLVYKYF